MQPTILDERREGSFSEIWASNFISDVLMKVALIV